MIIACFSSLDREISKNKPFYTSILLEDQSSAFHSRTIHYTLEMPSQAYMLLWYRLLARMFSFETNMISAFFMHRKKAISNVLVGSRFFAISYTEGMQNAFKKNIYFYWLLHLYLLIIYLTEFILVDYLFKSNTWKRKNSHDHKKAHVWLFSGL